MEAEDIMQESFLRAFEEIGTFSGKVSFGAWLKKIVQNRSIDILRKKNKVVFEGLDSVNSLVEVSPEISDQNRETDIRLSLVYEAIKRLSESCRIIFSLYFLEGYDYAEISEILSISASTSRSQVSRARRKLVKNLNVNK
jgi:RNA polymerase sigma-70 factor (ECF subfamily)